MPQIQNEHPTLWIKSTKSESLKGKTIVLAVTGSIAAVRTVELAREFIRRGAEVYAVMSEAAGWIINPMALHYATGNEVITEITGKVEHVEFFGNLGRADLLLIAPATANTLGKIAAGIDDTPVTTFATTAIGAGKPVMIVPAMHEDMYNHPAVMENIEKMKSWGISFIGPRIEEGIAKIAGNDEIVLEVEREIGKKTLCGKKILITSGSTAEPIDPIRILTNRASGKTGNELALEAYRRGAEVTIVHRNKLGVTGINEIHVETADQMTDAVLGELAKGYDVLISSAAIADYTLDASKQKIKSGDSGLELSFRNTRKLIKEARQAYPQVKIVGFKAEAGVDKEELVKRAKQTLESSGLDMIVANEVSKEGMGTVNNSITILYSNDRDNISIEGSKTLIANFLMDEITGLLTSKGEI
ncbi:bifunctional phosphopantothenoylcysteine decarboxylase/phosphopantothenate--cysteine ligase CoaBC [Methanolobus bombayensis]|uniref:bifunctional phosphopantothenoylcysteine decarboxylase/phosphopantothenate--cysteine ligase CoaBC n=1 Tax=Methanolobus bombayensis TaxID=38023 RepID=UPI001AE5132F|nr:bifunctional phosphopantothenoylcysteine decarboxylase/phosphopantothenate--cysteine ligase CoaBC [Methanolobus bombayensis]MBP1909430.1 phosphopantothenoylcysteine decarboxylase/phosphopantothenate--cysteine ligase [Methanolobus bombayensis]